VEPDFEGGRRQSLVHFTGFLATGLGSGQEMNKKRDAGDPTLGGNFVRDVVEGARDQDVGKVMRRNDVQSW
jgi:hypothetical protein